MDVCPEHRVPWRFLLRNGACARPSLWVFRCRGNSVILAPMSQLPCKLLGRLRSPWEWPVPVVDSVVCTGSWPAFIGQVVGVQQ